MSSETSYEAKWLEKVTKIVSLMTRKAELKVHVPSELTKLVSKYSETLIVFDCFEKDAVDAKLDILTGKQLLLNHTPFPVNDNCNGSICLINSTNIIETSSIEMKVNIYPSQLELGVVSKFDKNNNLFLP